MLYRIEYAPDTYDILRDAAPTVVILAVGVKQRNRVFIGNKEIKL